MKELLFAKEALKVTDEINGPQIKGINEAIKRAALFGNTSILWSNELTDNMQQAIKQRGYYIETDVDRNHTISWKK